MPRLSRTCRQKSGLAFWRVAMQSLLLLVLTLLNGVVTCDMAKAMLLGNVVVIVARGDGSWFNPRICLCTSSTLGATARVDRASGARGPLTLRVADAEGR